MLAAHGRRDERSAPRIAHFILLTLNQLLLVHQRLLAGCAMIAVRRGRPTLGLRSAHLRGRRAHLHPIKACAFEQAIMRASLLFFPVLVHVVKFRRISDCNHSRTCTLPQG